MVKTVGKSFTREEFNARRIAEGLPVTEAEMDEELANLIKMGLFLLNDGRYHMTQMDSGVHTVRMALGVPREDINLYQAAERVFVLEVP